MLALHKRQLSAAFDDLSESEVATKCDITVQSAMKSQSSFDTAWKWEFKRQTSTGRVSVTRNFEAQNAFGATLSSQYNCVVDAASMQIVSLSIMENGSWQSLFSE